jgi:hypothetical protein
MHLRNGGLPNCDRATHAGEFLRGLDVASQLHDRLGI